ncbi:MAG TPA: transporter substrate-binding domain-containing protein [Micromonosporaceae bacterium]|nr:transporter substrate-binding domain-containing protein [Micromonosporaceae bacterium]
MVAVVLLAVVTGMTVFNATFGQTPTEDQLKETAGLIGKQELRIGVGDDRPGLSYKESGTYSGFEIDIAYMIAARLGFDPSRVVFLSVPTEERRRMQGYDGNDDLKPVDMVIASYSITEEREALEEVSFSAPYLETQLSVVTRTDFRLGRQVQSLGELEGTTVCTLEAGTAVPWAEDSGLRDNLVKVRKISTCIDGLIGQERLYDAVVSDAALMAGWVDEHKDILRQHNIATDEVQRYGVNVGQNAALLTLVNLALYCSRYDPEDQRWEEAFRQHLDPLKPANDPQQVAKPVQPELPEPEVRRYLWEYWVDDASADRRRVRCD